jgi:hypothetical protein
LPPPSYSPSSRQLPLPLPVPHLPLYSLLLLSPALLFPNFPPHPSFFRPTSHLNPLILTLYTLPFSTSA